MSQYQVVKNKQGRYVFESQKLSVLDGVLELIDNGKKIAELYHIQGAPILKRYTDDAVDFVNKEGRVTSYICVGLDENGEYVIKDQHMPTLDGCVVLYDNGKEVGEIYRRNDQIKIVLHTPKQVNIFAGIKENTFVLESIGNVCLDAKIESKIVRLAAVSLHSFSALTCDELICQVKESLTFEEGVLDVKNKLNIEVRKLNQKAVMVARGSFSLKAELAQFQENASLQLLNAADVHVSHFFMLTGSRLVSKKAQIKANYIDITGAEVHADESQFNATHVSFQPSRGVFAKNTITANFLTVGGKSEFKESYLNFDVSLLVEGEVTLNDSECKSTKPEMASCTVLGKLLASDSIIRDVKIVLIKESGALVIKGEKARVLADTVTVNDQGEFSVEQGLVEVNAVLHQGSCVRIKNNGLIKTHKGFMVQEGLALVELEPEENSEKCKIILEQGRVEVGEDFSARNIHAINSKVSVGRQFVIAAGSRVSGKDNAVTALGDLACLGQFDMQNSVVTVKGDGIVHGGFATRGALATSFAKDFKLMYTGWAYFNNSVKVGSKCEIYGVLNVDKSCVIDVDEEFTAFYGSRSEFSGGKVKAKKISLDGAAIVKSIPKEKCKDGKSIKPKFVAKEKFATGRLSTILSSQTVGELSCFAVLAPVIFTGGAIDVEEARFKGDEYFNEGPLNTSKLILKMNRSGVNDASITTSVMEMFMPLWQNNYKVKVNGMCLSRTLFEQPGLFFSKSRDSKTLFQFGLNASIFIPPSLDDILTLRNLFSYTVSQVKGLLPQGSASIASMSESAFYLLKDILFDGNKLGSKLSRRYNENYQADHSRLWNLTHSFLQTSAHEWLRMAWEVKRIGESGVKLQQHYVEDEAGKAYVQEKIKKVDSQYCTRQLVTEVMDADRLSTSYLKTAASLFVAEAKSVATTLCENGKVILEFAKNDIQKAQDNSLSYGSAVGEVFRARANNFYDRYQKLPEGSVSQTMRHGAELFLSMALPMHNVESVFSLNPLLEVALNHQTKHFLYMSESCSLGFNNQIDAYFMLDQRLVGAYQVGMWGRRLVDNGGRIYSYTNVNIHFDQWNSGCGRKIFANGNIMGEGQKFIAGESSFSAKNIMFNFQDSLELGVKTKLQSELDVGLISALVINNASTHFKKIFDVNATEYYEGGSVTGVTYQVKAKVGKLSGTANIESACLDINKLAQDGAELNIKKQLTVIGEKWTLENKAKVTAAVIVGEGNTFDAKDSTLKATGMPTEPNQPDTVGIQLDYKESITTDKQTKLETHAEQDITFKAPTVRDASNTQYGRLHDVAAETYDHSGLHQGGAYQVKATFGELSGKGDVKSSSVEIKKLSTHAAEQLIAGTGFGAAYKIAEALHVVIDAPLNVTQQLVSGRNVDLYLQSPALMVSTSINSTHNLALESTAPLTLNHSMSAKNLDVHSAGNINNKAVHFAQQKLNLVSGAYLTQHKGAELKGKDILAEGNEMHLNGGSKIVGERVVLHTRQGDMNIMGEVTASDYLYKEMDNKEAQYVVRHEGFLHVCRPSSKCPKDKDLKPGNVYSFKEKHRWQYIVKDSQGQSHTGFYDELPTRPDNETFHNARYHGANRPKKFNFANFSQQVNNSVIEGLGLDQGKVQGGNGAGFAGTDLAGVGVYLKVGHGKFIGGGSVVASGHVLTAASSVDVIPIVTNVIGKSRKEGKSFWQKKWNMDRKTRDKHDVVQSFTFASPDGGVYFIVCGDFRSTAGIFKAASGFDIEAGGKIELLEYIGKNKKRNTQDIRPGRKEKSFKQQAYVTQFITEGYTTFQSNGPLNILGAWILTNGLTLDSKIAINISAPILKAEKLMTFTETKVYVFGLDVKVIFDAFSYSAVSLFERKHLPKKDWIKLWKKLCAKEEMIGLIGACLESDNVYEQVVNGWNIGISGVNLIYMVARGINNDNLMDGLTHYYGFDELSIKVKTTQYKMKLRSHSVAENAGIYSGSEINYIAPELNYSNGVSVHGHSQCFEVEHINGMAAKLGYRQTNTAHSVSAGYIDVGIDWERNFVRGCLYQNPVITADTTMEFIGAKSVSGNLAIQAEIIKGEIDDTSLTAVRDKERTSRTQFSINKALTDCSFYRGTSTEKIIRKGASSLQANDANELHIGTADLTGADLIVPGAKIDSVTERSLKVGKKNSGVGMAGNPREIAQNFSDVPLAVVKCTVDHERQKGKKKSVVFGAEIGKTKGSVHTKNKNGLKMKKRSSFHSTIFVPVTNGERMERAFDDIAGAGKKVESAFIKGPDAGVQLQKASQLGPVAPETSDKANILQQIDDEIIRLESLHYRYVVNENNQSHQRDENRDDIPTRMELGGERDQVLPRKTVDQETNQPTREFTGQDLMLRGLQDSSVGIFLGDKNFVNKDFHDLDTVDRLSYGVSSLAGDMPVIYATGKAVGMIAKLCKASPIGWVVTAAGGAAIFAVPMFIREVRQAYAEYKKENPNSSFSFAEFAKEYGVDILKETGKAAATGAIVGVASKGVAMRLAKTSWGSQMLTAPGVVGARAGTKKLTVAGSAVKNGTDAVSMVTVSEAMHGELPTGQALGDGILMFGFFHGGRWCYGMARSRVLPVISKPVQNFFRSGNDDTSIPEALVPVWDAIAVPYQKTDLPGSTVFHGTSAKKVNDVTAGPKNLGRGFGGPGLYFACNEPTIAAEYADIAVQSIGGKPVVMEGRLNPNAKYSVARITLAPRGEAPNLEKGIFPADWHKDPYLQYFMLRNFDIVEVIGARDAGYAMNTNRFIVVHKSAGIHAIKWAPSIKVNPLVEMTERRAPLYSMLDKIFGRRLLSAKKRQLVDHIWGELSVPGGTEAFVDAKLSAGESYEYRRMIFNAIEDNRWKIIDNLEMNTDRWAKASATEVMKSIQKNFSQDQQRRRLILPLLPVVNNDRASESDQDHEIHKVVSQDFQAKR